MTRRLRLLASCLAAAIVGQASCSWITGVDDDEFRIRVDSIVAPASVGVNDTLRLTLYGFVGPSGCYSLDRIDAHRTTHSIELTVRGRHRSGRGVACTQAMVFLNHLYAVPPPLGIPFSVQVRQPDGSLLTRPIPVE
jgi:hypothetical protein